jgi:single-strand DNA-binding protein
VKEENMNIAILTGRLTADPDVRYAQNGMAVASYTLAVDRRGEGADFIRCKAFGKQGEFAEKYLCKGKKILVTGRIQTGKYVNRKGDTVYTTDVVAEDHEFPESKGAETREADDFVPLPDTSEMPFR